MKYIYYYLTSTGEEGVIDSNEALFLDELTEEAGRSDIMITELKIIE